MRLSINATASISSRRSSTAIFTACRCSPEDPEGRDDPFEVRGTERLSACGGFDAAVKFYDALNLFLRLVNIGDTKSLAAHPASTTHRQLTASELDAAGVTPDMIRLCIGIEDLEDIVADLDQALDAAR